MRQRNIAMEHLARRIRDLYYTKKASQRSTQPAGGLCWGMSSCQCNWIRISTPRQMQSSDQKIQAFNSCHVVLWCIFGPHLGPRSKLQILFSSLLAGCCSTAKSSLSPSLSRAWSGPLVFARASPVLVTRPLLRWNVQIPKG